MHNGQDRSLRFYAAGRMRKGILRYALNDIYQSGAGVALHSFLIPNS